MLAEKECIKANKDAITSFTGDCIHNNQLLHAKEKKDHFLWRFHH